METIEGIEIVPFEEMCGFYITNFSDALKTRIRDRLVKICRGISDFNFPTIRTSYKGTVKELYNRIKNKSHETQLGMVGELLTHTLIDFYFPEYLAASAMFNLEESSIKKGFDLVLQKKGELWINEVKSGEIHKDETHTETIIDLIKDARSDLNERLNNGKTQLWDNAIVHARNCLSNYSDEKQIVESILNTKYEDVLREPKQGKNTNVFLTGVLFHNTNEKVDFDNVLDECKKIKSKQEFKSVFVISIQKSAIDNVIKFLREESE